MPKNPKHQLTKPSSVLNTIIQYQEISWHIARLVRWRQTFLPTMQQYMSYQQSSSVSQCDTDIYSIACGDDEPGSQHAIFISPPGVQNTNYKWVRVACREV